MKRLTIHIRNAPFTREMIRDKNTGSLITRERILNTLSFRVKDDKEAQSVLSRIESEEDVTKHYLTNIL